MGNNCGVRLLTRERIRGKDFFNHQVVIKSIFFESFVLAVRNLQDL